MVLPTFLVRSRSGTNKLLNRSGGWARVLCFGSVADHHLVTGLMNTILTALIASTFYPAKPEMRSVVLQGAVVPITP